MDKLDKQQSKISNKEIDWARHYDFYEVELRDMYRTVSKPQNDSHFEMLKNKRNKYLKKDKTFCEIGFSAGLTLRRALSYFGFVYGLDISTRNVDLTLKELTSEGYSNFELFSSDVMIYDKRFENKFDVISFIHGLEHFNSDDYSIMLSNIKKYLKPKGIFTGALPYKNRFNYRMCPDCMRVFEIDGHVSSHDINSLKNVFFENGFDIIHLDKFNLKYALKSGTVLKKVYTFCFYPFFKEEFNYQLEYIVTPKI